MTSAIFLLGLMTGFEMSGPEQAKTTAEILKCAEKEDMQGLHKEPYVSSMECRSPQGQAFVAWYNPYSGEAACHVYIYTFDAKKKLWIRQLAKMFSDTSDLSVEFGQAIIIRDVKGKEIHRYTFE